jgi:hypothetical protein
MIMMIMEKEEDQDNGVRVVYDFSSFLDVFHLHLRGVFSHLIRVFLFLPLLYLFS